MDAQKAKKAIEITADQFEAEVIKSDIPVLVDFWASWCMPCVMMAPVLDELAEKFEGKLKIVKISTENPDAQQLSFIYNIKSIPNMKLFSGGKIVGDFVGFRPAEAFEGELQEAIDKL